MAHEEQIAILLLEDSNIDAELVKMRLANELTIPPEIVRVLRLDDAIESLTRRDFDVVIVDLILPDSSGLRTFQEVQRHARDTAIVILSGVSDKDTALAAVREGAQDFVVKNQLEQGVLGRTIRFAVERSKRLQAFRFVEQILDSLPAHVAVLDADGTILTVNAAWRRFATQNHFIGGQFAIGANYLDICEFADRECAEEAESCVGVVGKLKTTKGEATEPTIPKVLKCQFSGHPIISFHLGNSRETLATSDVDTWNA